MDLNTIGIFSLTPQEKIYDFTRDEGFTYVINRENCLHNPPKL